MVIVFHLLRQPYRFSAFALQPAQVTGRREKNVMVKALLAITQHQK